jgi:hypothetical protein
MTNTQKKRSTKGGRITLSGLRKSLSKMPEALTKMPKALTKMPEALTKMPEALTKMPEALSKMPEALTKMPEALSKMPKFAASIMKRKYKGGNGYLAPATFTQDASVPGALSSARFYPAEPVISNEVWGGISARNIPMTGSETGVKMTGGRKQRKTRANQKTRKQRKTRKSRKSRNQKGGSYSVTNPGGLTTISSALSAGANTGLTQSVPSVAPTQSSQFPLTSSGSGAGNTTVGATPVFLTV